MKSIFVNLYVFVICTVLFLQFGLNPIAIKVINPYFQPAVIEYNRQLSRGVFSLMVRELQRWPKQSWPKRIEAMQGDFGYAIELSSLSELNLKKELISELAAGKIVVEGDGDYLYYRVADSDFVIKKGPFSVLEPEPFKAILIFYCLALVPIALLTWLGSWPSWRRLQIIRQAASRFGKGDLSTRAVISKRTALSTLAEDFNKMAERIERLINSHKELTNGVAHELRTPLARMRFGLEMLAEARDNDARENYLQGLRLDVDELAKLVEELLTLARMERERPTLQLKQVSGAELCFFLETVLFEARQPESTVKCILQCDLPAGFVVPGFDARYLSRALGNLVKNGCIHARSRVELSAAADGRDLLLHIDDDGPGIPEDARSKIFEPFTRLDSSRSRESGGYGLGLTIVAGIIAWHGGSVTVAASPLGGARFTVRLVRQG